MVEWFTLYYSFVQYNHLWNMLQDEIGDVLSNN